MLLLGGALALAGCTLGDNVEWLPWKGPDPLPVTIPAGVAERIARTSALAGHLSAHASDWSLSSRRVTTLRWFGRATDEHLAVLRSSDPARRQRASTPAPSQSPPAQGTAAATQAALTKDLIRLRDSHRTSALAASGLPALLWASLAAFSATTALRLPTGLGSLGDDGTDSAPELTGTGADRVLQLAAQAAYGYESALAASGLSKADERTLRNRLTQWRTLRAAILAAAPEVDPGAPPVGYDLRPARNRTAAWQLAAQIETAAVPVFGAWIAGTSAAAERRLGVDALIAGNNALARFDGTAPRWPGWPG